MKDYAVEICEIFAWKFPKSSASRGGRRLRISDWQKRFPEILDDYRAKESFLDSIDHLSDHHIVEPIWKRFREREELVALYLLDDAALYLFLNRIHPSVVCESLLHHITSRQPTSALARQIREIFLTQLQTEDSIVPEMWQVGTHEELQSLTENITDLLGLCELSSEECALHTVRQLSIKLYNNSKRIEQLLQFGNRNLGKFLQAPLSELLNLSRVYPESTCTLSGSFVFQDSRSWEIGYESVTLPLSTISSIQRYEPKAEGEHLLVLENKESYYTAWNRLKNPNQNSSNQKFSGFLYVGGFPNTADESLLRILSDSGIQISCFCDLDPAGLLIAQKIVSICNGRAKAYNMDVETYATYAHYGYDLSPSELGKLHLVEQADLKPLAALIAQTKRGVEQEIIPIN